MYHHNTQRGQEQADFILAWIRKYGAVLTTNPELVAAYSKEWSVQCRGTRCAALDQRLRKMHEAGTLKRHFQFRGATPIGYEYREE